MSTYEQGTYELATVRDARHEAVMRQTVEPGDDAVPLGAVFPVLSNSRKKKGDYAAEPSRR